MGSPAYWGKLVNFEASLRKPALIAFGLFSPGDNLSFIADLPTQGATFSPTLTPPDGSRTTFNFNALPLYIVWNGVIQFQNVGYTLTNPSIGLWVATFIDFAGNVLTPGVTDYITAETTPLSVLAPTAGRQATRAAIVWAASLTMDTSLAEILTVTLTGNVTTTTLTYASTPVPDNTQVMLRFTQDATGGRSVVLPANLQFDTGFAIDPTPLRTTVLPIIYYMGLGKWVFTSAPFSEAGS